MGIGDLFQRGICPRDQQPCTGGSSADCFCLEPNKRSIERPVKLKQPPPEEAPVPPLVFSGEEFADIRDFLVGLSGLFQRAFAPIYEEIARTLNVLASFRLDCPDCRAEHGWVRELPSGNLVRCPHASTPTLGQLLETWNKSQKREETAKELVEYAGHLHWCSFVQGDSCQCGYIEAERRYRNERA